MRDLDGAVALVTGGASGIGLALGRSLTERGVRVVLADIAEDALAPAAADCPAALALPLDVTDRGQWAAVRDRVEAEVGPIDILCNVAGIGPDGNELADMPPGNWDRIIAINLTSVFNGISAIAPGLRTRGRGHVVNVASMAGLVAMAPLGGYTAAKFGVVAMSEVARAELAPHGVGVSVVCPGSVKTPMTGNLDGRLDRPVQMDPAWVGRRIVQAIVDDEPLVITHPGRRGSVEARMKAVLAAFDVEPAEPGFVEGLIPGLF